MSSDSLLLLCRYCGDLFESEDPRMRFCSDRCITLFNIKHGVSKSENFKMDNELNALLTLIKQYDSSLYQEKDPSRQVDLYHHIFDHISNIVKWINASVIKSELSKENDEEYVIELEERLAKVLRKTVQLKRENKELKHQLRNLQNADVNLAYTLLGVTESVSEKELQQAFRSKAKQTHPDVGDIDQSVFKAVKSAYDLITTQIKVKNDHE